MPQSLSLLLLLIAALSAQTIRAHEITPSIVTITLGDDHRAQVRIKTNLEAVLADIGAEHDDTDESPKAARYNTLRAMSSAELGAVFDQEAATLSELLQLTFDKRPTTLTLSDRSIPETGNVRIARSSELSFDVAVPLNAATLEWHSNTRFGDVVLKVANSAGQKAGSQWLKNGAASKPVALEGVLEPATMGEVVSAYLVLGFTHIVPKGLDHILFVLGLFLLSVQWRPLLYQVTAFTLAHTITLGLAIYGVIALSPAIVEPLIALSIVYVAVENIYKPTLKPSRVALVFAFGLLHGLGFAGVLEELGLPEGEYLTALISFNVGVEFGQLAVIVAAFGAFGLWFKDRPWYRQAFVIPGSIAIAATGGWWFIERTVL